MTTIINGSSPSITFSDGSAQTSATRPFQNRIINGAMVIDQRNAGASVTVNGAAPYTLDRWQAEDDTDGAFTVQQDAGAVTPPVGFTDYLGVTTTTADASLAAGQYSRVQQCIEGYNIADLGWGTASAKTVTLSFWVRSSLTGTFGGALQNGTYNRSYPFTYTISTANTWEQKSITIAGDTTGTWATTNGRALFVQFGLGVGSTYSGTAGAWAASNLISATGATSVIGTLSATWYITGVQLEVGSTATSFDYRPYGTELALCQRYFYSDKAGTASSIGIMGGGCFSTTLAILPYRFPVVMRAAPTLSVSSNSHFFTVQNGGVTTISGFSLNAASTIGARCDITSASMTAGGGTTLCSQDTSAAINWSAEL
jgi:hypothetical protein